MAAKSRKTVKNRKSGKHVTRSASLPRNPREAGELLKHTWDTTLASLAGAQADLEKQVKSLLKRNRIDASDASALLQSLNAAFVRERKQAVKALDGRVKSLQTRIAKERKAVGKRIDGAVQSALGSLNIPSRSEVAELTRKVEALSGKVDRLVRR